MTSFDSIFRAKLKAAGLADSFPHLSSLVDTSSRGSRSRAFPRAAIFAQAGTLLRSGWQWVAHRRAEQLSARRLRVAETISLGEKRFVSILQVDDAQFLIGVSGSGVQLLAMLEKEAQRSGASESEVVH